MLFLASCLWGVCIPVMKALGTEQYLLDPSAGSLGGSAASLCARFGLAAVTVLLLARRSPLRIRAAELKHGVILGVLTALSMFLQVDGLSYTSASTAGFLIAMYCVIVPILAWAGGKRRMTLVLSACCILVIAGMAVLTGFDPRAFNLGRGELENLGAACLFACQILWVDRVHRDHADPFRLTFALCATVSLACLAALVFLPGGPGTLILSHASLRAVGLTLFLAFLGTTLPFLIMNRFQSKVGPVTAGFIYCVEPLTAALGAFLLPELLVRDPSLYPNEALTAKLAAGGLLILAANLLLLRDKPKPA
jgi:drug/metabolite transporter (DMT)-like permease